MTKTMGSPRQSNKNKRLKPGHHSPHRNGSSCFAHGFKAHAITPQVPDQLHAVDESDSVRYRLVALSLAGVASVDTCLLVVARDVPVGVAFRNVLAAVVVPLQKRHQS
jgi:hypothetical protein